MPPSHLTLEALADNLKQDTKVKVAGVDLDGILRGKLMAKKKFLSIAKDGFGFCSVIFGWDMHDRTYFRELKVSNKENGYRDIIAVPDLSSFRRIPWENNVPFFLVSYFDPVNMKPLSACPRSLLKAAVDRLGDAGYGVLAGGQFPDAGRGDVMLRLRCRGPDPRQPSMSSTNFGRHRILPSHPLSAVPHPPQSS
jgi:glutamine synthetase